MKANYESMYQHIGCLFYALASEERTLSTYDLNKLKTEIAETLQPLTTGDAQFHYRLVKSIHDGINECHIDSLSGFNAFELFEDYYLVHHLNFSTTTQEQILQASNQISREYFSPVRHEAGSQILHELRNLVHPRIACEFRCEPAIIISYSDVFNRPGDLRA
jgi:hypothetical protein